MNWGSSGENRGTIGWGIAENRWPKWDPHFENSAHIAECRQMRIAKGARCTVGILGHVGVVVGMPCLVIIIIPSYR